jgi:hypothetical protein
VEPESILLGTDFDVTIKKTLIGLFASVHVIST